MNDDNLFDNFLSTVPEDIRSILNINSFSGLSEKLEIGTVIKAALKLFSEQFNACWTLLATLLVIVMLISFMEKLEFTSSGVLKRITSGVASITLISLSLVYINSNFESVKDAVETMKIFTSASVPVIVASCISSGEAFSATLFSTTMSFANAMFDLLLDKVLLSLIVAYICFGATGSISQRFNSASVNTYVKRFIKWIVGLYIGVLTFLVSLQRFVGSATDNLAKRSIKLAVGSLIPFIGSSISTSIDSAFALGQAGKTTVCVSGVIVLMVIFAPVIIGCICYGFVFSITKAIAYYLEVNSIVLSCSVIGDSFYILAGLLCACVYSVIISFFVICINI